MEQSTQQVDVSKFPSAKGEHAVSNTAHSTPDHVSFLTGAPFAMSAIFGRSISSTPIVTHSDKYGCATPLSDCRYMALAQTTNLRGS